MKNKVFVIVFAVLLAILTLGNIFSEKKEFSDNENRTLAVFPEFSWEGLKDGSFTSDFAEYIADHFVFRDAWVSIKSVAETMSLKTSNNGVYNGKDGYLIDSFDEESASGFESNLDAVRIFEDFVESEYEIDVKTIIAPTAATVLNEKLPAFAVTADGDTMLKRAQETLDGYIDVSIALDAHKDEYLYYRTDHHWTNTGAYYAYCEYKSALGETALPLDDIDTQIVTEEFYGTTYSRFGMFAFQQADMVSAPSQDYIGTMTVTNSSNEVFESIYHPEMLNEKDKYLYFLGGNDSIVTVETENKNSKTLLLIKDSYANAFLPYVSKDFEKIIVVDMRYYLGIIPELISDEEVTDILILYNLKSFAEDQYIEFINFTE